MIVEGRPGQQGLGESVGLAGGEAGRPLSPSMLKTSGGQRKEAEVPVAMQRVDPRPDEEKLSEEDKEQLRTEGIHVEEIDLGSQLELENYFNLLRNRSNRQHFTNVPKTIEDLRRELSRPGIHGLVIKNALDEIDDPTINPLHKIIGYSMIEDPPEGQEDAWIKHAVIANYYQNRKERDRSKNHVGTRSMRTIIKWAFETKTTDGRERTKLNAAVVKWVPNWERAYHMFDLLGFRDMATFKNQAIVQLADGKIVRTDTDRFELERDYWEAMESKRVSQETSSSHS